MTRTASVFDKHIALVSAVPANQAAGRVPFDWIAQRITDYLDDYNATASTQAAVKFTRSEDSFFERIGYRETSLAGWSRFAWLDQQTVLLYVNPELCASAGFADTVIAHQFTHVNRPSLGHRDVFWRSVQRTLNQRAHNDAHGLPRERLFETLKRLPPGALVMPQLPDRLDPKQSYLKHPYTSLVA